ncbi:helix-turn-helix domain-containing protein [Peribacillus simplex]|uniref:helix-turn-helix domain-containing protein n=1 Tax=Peribacillus simplex TaxID=1478 RepID=UPI00119D23A6|nr:helix-turn-helix transcriptional regulator [Peribacillus simplex]
MSPEEKKRMGLRIKMCRQNINLSQETLAENLGMKRTNIANYEAGRVIPPGNILMELADIFGVSTDYLLGRSIQDGIQKLDEVNEEVRALARDINHLNAGDKDLLKDLIKTMSKRGKEALNE